MASNDKHNTDRDWAIPAEVLCQVSVMSQPYKHANKLQPGEGKQFQSDVLKRGCVLLSGLMRSAESRWQMA